MKHPAITYCLFLAAAILGVSCAEEECTNLDDPQLVIEFRTSDSTATTGRRERVDTLIIHSLTGLRGTRPADTLYSGSHSSVLLPLSQISDTTSFQMIYSLREDTTKKVWKDIIAVRYERQPFFVSDVCGFNVRFTNLTLDMVRTTYPKDSISVQKNIVDESNTANIRMYFK
jgi:hypothetical protein